MVDIGSNSTKVLIALVNTNGEVVKVREEGSLEDIIRFENQSFNIQQGDQQGDFEL